MKPSSLSCILCLLLVPCGAAHADGPEAGLVSRPEAPTPSPPPPEGLISRIEAPRATPALPEKRILEATLIFPDQKSKLTPEEETKFKELVSSVRTGKVEVIIIEAMANESSTVEYRLAIADKRAQAVKTLFVMQGIAHDRISTKASARRSWIPPEECKRNSVAKQKKAPCTNPGSPAQISVTLLPGR